MTPAEPDPPPDPVEDRPRPLMGAGFWIMLAFGILCVLAGIGVATLAPRLSPPPAPASAAEPAPGDAS